MRGTDDLELEELSRRWRESQQRSGDRRQSSHRRPRRSLVWAACAIVVILSVVVALPPAGGKASGWISFGGAGLWSTRSQPSAEPESRRRSSHALLPQAGAVRRAWSYARRRGGTVSLAVVDTAGHLRGRAAGRPFVSASVVKAMLLAAELRRLRNTGLPLDPETDGLLGAMVMSSDNDAADSIYYRVGDDGLGEVARLAGMRRFAVAGHWTTAQVTAADLARYFSRLPRRLAGPHREWALTLLGSVVKEQRWGIPRAAGNDWRVFFKGGWRATGQGELVHQAALLRRGNRKLAIAVLTDAQPSQVYAIHTVRGIAERLLAERPASG